MKCRNCGATYHGIACPVCGQKHLKKTRCSVCFTILFPGQETCPKCGSPTVYRQNDGIKTVHSSAAGHYQQLDSYDFQKDAYNYKKDAYHFHEGKMNAFRNFSAMLDPLHQNSTSHHQAKKQSASIPGIVILILLFIAFSIFSTILFN